MIFAFTLSMCMCFSLKKSAFLCHLVKLNQHIVLHNLVPGSLIFLLPGDPGDEVECFKLQREAVRFLKLKAYFSCVLL